MRKTLLERRSVYDFGLWCVCCEKLTEQLGMEWQRGEPCIREGRAPCIQISPQMCEWCLHTVTRQKHTGKVRSKFKHHHKFVLTVLTIAKVTVPKSSDSSQGSLTPTAPLSMAFWNHIMHTHVILFLIMPTPIPCKVLCSLLRWMQRLWLHHHGEPSGHPSLINAHYHYCRKSTSYMTIYLGCQDWELTWRQI